MSLCSLSMFAAEFNDFTAYKNGRSGVIGSVIGDLRFNNFKLLDHQRTGAEVTKCICPFGTCGMYNSLVVGHSDNQMLPLPSTNIDTTLRTTLGFIAPSSENYTVQDTTFVNFDADGFAVFSSCDHCNFPNTKSNGARTAHFKVLTMAHDSSALFQ